MKFFIISDNIDTCIGMRMTGIEGVVVHEQEEVKKALSVAFDDKEIGLVLMTKKLIDLTLDTVLEYKLNYKRPLIVEIPDRHATSQISDTISRYIQEAVGIKI
ncbi:MAG: V-type ATP synthase subunit F [Oscillospiraceae bacterium]